MGKELLLEIGTEEIPAGYTPPSLEQLRERFAAKIAELKLECGSITAFATPRRLVIVAQDLAEKQADFEEEVTGPPKKVAVDTEGKYTKAAEGFASTNNIDLNSLRIITKDKKEYLGFTRKNTGADTFELMKGFLPELVLSLTFPKFMRWAEGNLRYVRPIHWVLALYGGNVIPFTVGDVQSSGTTRGHRFMANRSFDVKSFNEFRTKLKDSFVIIDAADRKQTIVSKAEELAKSVNGTIDRDQELFDILSYLVEYPVPMLGNFEERFLKLPKEILINTMKKHQKYIPIFDNKGELLPYFIIVSNIEPKDRQVVVNGNSKVVRARFSDADYYFQKDKKIPLADRVPGLNKVVFQVKLGSYFEKTERLVKLCDHLGSFYPDVKEDAKKAAYLCKADLITGMVYEFPSLQGIIGGELAKLHNEPENIYKAVYEHYLPQSPDDPVPSSMTGVLLSLADKLDNLAGFFGLGLQPKGTSDPYGMRRQAIGVIRLLLENNIETDFPELLAFAYKSFTCGLSVSLDDTVRNLTEFIENRFFYQMEMQGFSTEVINAVMATHPRNLARAKKLIELFDGESRKDSFKELSNTVKRVGNITKAVKGGSYSADLFKSDAETALFAALGKAEKEFDSALKSDLGRIPALFIGLKPAIDAYFEKVLVMDKDEKVKQNNLNFLYAVRSLFDRVIDFTKIQL